VLRDGDLWGGGCDCALGNALASLRVSEEGRRFQTRRFSVSEEKTRQTFKEGTLRRRKIG